MMIAVALGMMAKRQTSRGLDVGVQQYWQSAGARFLPLMLRSKGLWTVSKNVSKGVGKVLGRVVVV